MQYICILTYISPYIHTCLHKCIWIDRLGCSICNLQKYACVDLCITYICVKICTHMHPNRSIYSLECRDVFMWIYWFEVLPGVEIHVYVMCKYTLTEIAGDA